MFVTQVSKNCGETQETPRKKQRTLPKPTVSVSTDICQLCKGEDVVPAFLKTDTHVAMLVGDGHGGKEAAQTLNQYSDKILKTVLESGVEDGMRMCVELCQFTEAGAMVVISLYSMAGRILEVVSMGDASCTVYQGGNLIHEQPHHSRQYVDAGGGTCKSASGQEITWKEKAAELGIQMRLREYPCMAPQPDGRTMLVDVRPEYFNWTVNQIAGCSFVGHSTIARLPACKKILEIPPGPFHLVMASDGVSDVMHPEDAVLKTHAVKADNIVAAVKQRWTTPFFNPSEQEAYEGNNEIDPETGKKYFDVNPRPTMKNTRARWKTGAAFYSCSSYEQNDDGTYDVVFNDGDTRASVPTDEIKIVEYNSGADDISVLVMTVE